jgi:hypothetical protein
MEFSSELLDNQSSSHFTGLLQCLVLLNPLKLEVWKLKLIFLSVALFWLSGASLITNCLFIVAKTFYTTFSLNLRLRGFFILSKSGSSYYTFPFLTITILTEQVQGIWTSVSALIVANDDSKGIAV